MRSAGPMLQYVNVGKTVAAGTAVNAGLLRYLSPLSWEHINLAGNHVWRRSLKWREGKFRRQVRHFLAPLGDEELLYVKDVPRSVPFSDNSYLPLP